MNIFITGIAGFLGSHLADALIAQGHNVLGCDINTEELLANMDVIRGDCRNLDRMTKWLRNFNTDVVIHCAALPHEGLSVFSPAAITDSIYRGSIVTFSAAISVGVRRIVNCSSMARYGDITSPFRETDFPKPVDPYGIAKLAAERTLEALAQVHEIEYVTAVPHNIYGPRQCRTDPYRNVIAIMMNRILQGRAPIIYGNGTQRRCFSYIDDVVPALVLLATDYVCAPDMHHLFNIGPDTGDVNILQLFAMVKDAMGYRGPPVHYGSRPSEVHTANCLADRARLVLGYKPETSLHEGIKKMANWIREVGPKPFNYKIPLEIITDKTPRTWRDQEI